VLSSSKTASVISPVNDRLSGGVGVRLPLLCGALLRALREKMAPAIVRTFLFLILALRSGDVFGRVGALVVCTTGEKGVKETLVIGSKFSKVGVCFGVVLGEVSVLPPEVNQNLFLLTGLPELASKLVESDAESGLFGRALFSTSSNPMDTCELELAASAVLGLGAGLLSSKLGEGVDRAAGLPSDVMLPVKE
jgi:hypothetical protein